MYKNDKGTFAKLFPLKKFCAYSNVSPVVRNTQEKTIVTQVDNTFMYGNSTCNIFPSLSGKGTEHNFIRHKLYN